MIAGERYRELVRLEDVLSGQKPHTAQYGAEFNFRTTDGKLLLWDTNSREFLDYLDDTKSLIKISFTVERTPQDNQWLGENTYQVINVRKLK